MKRIVRGRDQEVSRWVASQVTDDEGDYDLCTAIGLEDDAGLICGVVYNGYKPGASIQMHTAIIAQGRKLACSVYPEFLKAVFHYPFHQLKVRRVTGLVAASNKKSIKICEHLGFRAEGVMRHGLPNDDLIIMGMLREECRYL